MQAGATTTRRRSACPRTRTATPRATCSRRPTTSPPNATPASVLKTMVDEFKARADDAKLEQGAADLGRSAPTTCVTIASLVQAEASRPQDMPKVASVIYNRLDIGHAAAARLDPALRGRQPRGDRRRATTSRTSTRRTTPTQLTGLPPTPIDSPGDDAHQRRAAPGRHDLSLLRDGQPARPARRCSRRRSPSTSRTSQMLHRVLRRPPMSADAAEPWHVAVRCPRQPDLALAVAGPASRRRTARSGSTGSTTSYEVTEPELARFLAGLDPTAGGALSLTMPLKRAAYRVVSTR